MSRKSLVWVAVIFGAWVGIAPVRAQVCPGDCDGNGRVRASELTRMVALILFCAGEPVGCPSFDRGCPAGDSDGSGTLDVADLIQVIRNVLLYDDGCPPGLASPTPSTPPTPTASATPESLDSPSPTATASASPTSAPLPSHTPTASATPAATATPSPTAAPAICGNGIVEEGETCDDGNQVTNPPTDTCPANCRVETCSPSSNRFNVAVQFTGGTNIASIATILEYPDGVVQLPGTGTDASVGSRITNRPSGFLTDWFDFDFALRVAVVGSRALTSSQLYVVSFDVCRDTAPPPASAFRCRVLEANNTNFQPVSGLTCTAVAQ